MRLRRQTSQALAVLALGLWTISLTQPALVVDGGRNIHSGLEILWSGWWALIEGSLAWCANLTFAFAVAMLFAGKTPWKSALLTMLLALDTFRLAVLPGGAAIDAYAMGVPLWFAAFAVLLIAVGVRRVDASGQAVSRALQAPLVFAGMVALASVVGSYSYLRVQQSRSTAEVRYNAAGFLKLGPLCNDVVAVPTTRLRLDGPLEVIGSTYPLGSPARLLAWGIPVVRKQGFDFALGDAADINSIYWKPADGAAVATLALSGKDHDDTIEAVLTSADGLTTAFRQSWTRDRKSAQYCPEYPTGESDASSPRNLLIAALDVPGGLKPVAISRMQNALSVAPFTRESLANAKIHGVRSDSAAAGISPLDAGCAPRAGFLAKDPGALTLAYAGQTFGIDDRRYYLMNNQPLSAVCDGGDSVYLYYFWLNSDRKSFLLYIQRRHLAGFRQVWTMVTGLDYQRAEPFKGKADVRIRSLSEKDGQVSAELIDIEQSLAVSVSFGVPGR